MKVTYVLLVCFFSLPLLLLGCGDTEKSSNLMDTSNGAKRMFERGITEKMANLMDTSNGAKRMFERGTTEKMANLMGATGNKRAKAGPSLVEITETPLAKNE